MVKDRDMGRDFSSDRIMMELESMRVRGLRASSKIGTSSYEQIESWYNRTMQSGEIVWFLAPT